ncbi:MAG TPA: hypothetical protein PKD53_16980 [Chloroflexaceae bacterium]|nr:hypothetical protein [Chloroflexaceae bacterium]
MQALLQQVFERLNQAQISYCLLRDHDELVQSKGLSEVDLLVEQRQVKRLAHALASLGFAPLPRWGYAPHHFFVADDEQADGRIKLDVVTALAYGKPIPLIDTDLATECLSRRRRDGAVYVPAPEAELVALLLHCVLDKGGFSPSRRRRLLHLRQAARDAASMNRLVKTYWSPTVSWPQLAALIEAEDWSALLAQSPTVARHLTRKSRIETVALSIGRRLLRKLNRRMHVQRVKRSIA